MELRPVGYVRSSIRGHKEMPPLGAPASVEVLPEYAAGLLRMEKHTHIWILAWLDSAERNVLQVTPRGVADQGPSGLHGVFAVRSPARPNPIGMTVSRLLRVNGRLLELDRLDFLDGTPVVDIKPYFASRDIVFSASNQQIGRPASREALRQSLWMQAKNFHGAATGDLALGVRVVEHFRSEVLEMIEPPEWTVSVSRRRLGVMDAVIATTRATPGRGNLGMHRREAVRFEHENSAFDYELIATADNEARVILEADDADLFEFEVFGL